MGETMELEAVEQRRFTVEEYHGMAKAGILRPDERVELIRGVVRPMRAKHYAHVVAATRLSQLLVAAVAGRASVFQESPLKLVSLGSEPEPDILVLSSPNIEDYGTAASRPVLVVEVADSSRHFDLHAKASLYADAGVPEYWVLDLVERVLIAFRAPGEGRYPERVELSSGERIAPEAWPDVVLEVAQLLPPDAPAGAPAT